MGGHTDLSDPLSSDLGIAHTCRVLLVLRHPPRNYNENSFLSFSCSSVSSRFSFSWCVRGRRPAHNPTLAKIMRLAYDRSHSHNRPQTAACNAVYSISRRALLITRLGEQLPRPRQVSMPWENDGKKGSLGPLFVCCAGPTTKHVEARIWRLSDRSLSNFCWAKLILIWGFPLSWKGWARHTCVLRRSCTCLGDHENKKSFSILALFSSSATVA